MCFPTSIVYTTEIVPHWQDISSKISRKYTKLNTIRSGVPQGSTLGPILYSIITAELPETEQTLTVTYADDTAILASHQNPITVSRKLPNHLNQFEKWLKPWRIKADENKSTHVTFTLKRENCPTVKLNGNQIPQGETAMYLGIYVDRRMTWRTHIFVKKRKQLGLKFQQMYWILGRKSELSI